MGSDCGVREVRRSKEEREMLGRLELVAFNAVETIFSSLKTF